jgi:hypothetical protein
MAKGQGQGVVLGYLRYVLGFDSLAFQEGLGDADKRLKAAQRSLAKTADKFKSIGATMSLALTAPLIGFGATAINEAREASAAMAQVNAALNSMGPVAGRAAEQLKATSDAMEMSSLAEGDEILRKVTANMLTFGNIAGENFDKAQQAAIDLSARLGTDLQSSAILVGKALNDPTKGMAALGRAGIQFSTDQKAAIAALVKTGDVAGAQAIILGEFQKQFGGAAQAAQNADPFNKASDAFKQMAETVGNALLPIIPVVTDAIVTVAGAFTSLSPEMQKVVIIGGALVAVLGPVLIGIGGMISAFGVLLPLLTGIGPLIAGLVAGFTAFIPIVIATTKALALMALTPIGAIITGIALAVGAVYLAWKNWDKIVEIVRNLYTGVKTWLMDRLGAVFDWVKGKLQAVGQWFYDLYDKVVGHSYIPDMVDAIGHHMARLDANMVKVAQNATMGVGAAFKKLEQDIQPIMDRLFPERAKARQFILDRDAIEGAAGLSPTDRAEALRRLGAEKNDWASDVIGGSMLGETVEKEWAQADAANDNLAQSFEGMVRDISGSLQSLGRAIKSGDWLDILSTAIDAGLSIYQAFKGGKISFGGARATGGPVSSGRSYLVGERGPEMFTPRRDGYIHPNSKGGAQKPTIVQLVVGPGQFFEPAVAGISGNVSVQVLAEGSRASYRRGRQRLA